MKVIRTAILIACFIPNMYGQDKFKVDFKPKKSEVIYLTFSPDTEPLSLSLFTLYNEIDAQKKLTSKEVSINIYMKWINPLKYRISWKDTVLTDDRDKAIGDFFKSLVGNFSPFSSIGEPDQSGRDSGIAVSDSVLNQPGIPDINIESVNIKDKELILLFSLLVSNVKVLKNSEREQINKFAKELERLDELKYNGYQDKALKIYNNLFSLDNLTQYQDKIGEINEELEDLRSNVKSIEEQLKKTLEQKANLELNESNFVIKYFNSVVSDYCNRVSSTLVKRKRTLEALSKIMETFTKSVKNKSSKSELHNYFFLRIIDFDQGQKLESNLTISEYEFNEETLEFKKESEIINQKLEFRKFDPVVIRISSGFFYASTKIEGYGVTNGENEEFIVSSSDLEKNTAVSALFANFVFGESRYFAPIVQIGLDPTKERPLILAGIGFTVSAAKNFALSGGPLWTWTPSLDKLEVGQKINSTDELQDDIKYTFEIKPKGWYIGLQYQF